MRGRLAVAVLLAAFLVSVVAAGRAEAARFATAKEQRALVSEAIYYLRILARSGTALFSPGLKVVVQPACVSTVDPAFSLVTLFALEGGKQVGEPGQLWMGRLGSGPPRGIGSVLLAEGIGTRPRGVSVAAFRDTLNAPQCVPQFAEIRRRVRAGGLRVYTL
jgi:hypothetical protein